MTEAGWRPDPTGQGGLRYWDGTQWTEHVSAAGRATSGKKVPAGICGILIGALGIHKFVLGYTAEGLIMLLVSVLTCGLGAIVMGPIGLIEGIIYLTKSDEAFDATYVDNKRGWF